MAVYENKVLLTWRDLCNKRGICIEIHTIFINQRYF